MGVLIHLPSSEGYGYDHLADRLSPRLYTPASSPSPSPSLSPEDDKSSACWSSAHSHSEGECASLPQDTALSESVSTDADAPVREDACVSRDGDSAPAPQRRRRRVLSRKALRRYMLTHSVVGDKLSTMAKSRTPFVGEISNFVSPIDKEVIFGIKRLNNRDVESYRDKNSVVRFISDEGDGNKFVQEKDYPMGTMRTDTALLGLADWNIVDENNVPVKITRKSMLELLDPRELDAIYERVLEVNPILTGRDAEKND